MFCCKIMNFNGVKDKLQVYSKREVTYDKFYTKYIYYNLFVFVLDYFQT